MDGLFTRPRVEEAQHQGNVMGRGDDLTRFFDETTLKQARAIIFSKGRQYGFDETGKLKDKNPDSSPELRSRRSREGREKEALWLEMEEGLTPQKKEMIGAVVALLHRGIKEENGPEAASRLSEHIKLRIGMNAGFLSPDVRPEATGAEGAGSLLTMMKYPSAHRMPVSEGMMEVIGSQLNVIDAMLKGEYDSPESEPQEEFDVWATDNPDEKLNQLVHLYRYTQIDENVMRFHNSHTRAVNFLRACQEMMPGADNPVIEVQDIASFVGSVFLQASRAMDLTVDPRTLDIARQGLSKEQSRAAVIGV